MTSSSSIPTTTTTTNVNASLLNYKCNNTSESNLSRRHTHQQPPCRPNSLSVTISTIPICNLQSPQTPNAIDDDELHQYYPGPSAAVALRPKSNAKINNIGYYVHTKFNTLVGSITGGAANKRHRYNGNNCGVIDANNMALSCTAADEEIAPLSPNRAERIIRNEQINHPTNMEFMEQRAELLKGILFFVQPAHLRPLFPLFSLRYGVSQSFFFLKRRIAAAVAFAFFFYLMTIFHHFRPDQILIFLSLFLLSGFSRVAHRTWIRVVRTKC